MENRLYTLNFVNGTASVSLPVGTYTYVSNTIPGYAGHSFVSSFRITSETQSVALSITADGVLNVRVVDELSQPIIAGSLNLSDAEGKEQYGNNVLIRGDGTASFRHVPYADESVTLHINQSESDSQHYPISYPATVTMNQKLKEYEIQNRRKSTPISFTVNDKYYDGMLPLTGDIVFSN